MNALKQYLTAQNLAVALAAWCVLVTGAASIVASLINICTPYPKVETTLHRIQDRLAFLQHFDSSPTLLGILQWPIFQRSNPPAIPLVRDQAVRGFARLLVLNLLCMLSFAVIAGCAWFQKTGEPALLQCTAQQADTALGDVGEVLISGSQQWQTELEAKGAVVGTDIVLCAIQKWINQQNTTGTEALDPRVVTGIKRGQLYLKQSGKTVVLN